MYKIDKLEDLLKERRILEQELQVAMSFAGKQKLASLIKDLTYEIEALLKKQ